MTVFSPWITAIVLFTLGAIFAGSWLMFWLLVERSTHQRESVAIAEWGRDHGMPLRACPLELPEPFKKLADRRLTVRACLSGKRGMLLKIESDVVDEGALASAVDEPARAAPKSDSDSRNNDSHDESRGPGLDPPLTPTHWHVLIRTIAASWAPTGLRPTHHPRSVLDLFSLTSFPTLGATDRFVVYGTESQAAQHLSRSSARGLLPPDIGLLLYANQMLLDFSSRPFDEIEFNRMLALADQIEKHVAGR